MSERAAIRGVRGGFTLLDVMITVVILAILAAVALPLVSHYIEDAEEAQAQTTYDSVRKALDLYMTQHGTWPDEITPALFVNEEPPLLPAKYTFEYNPDTGDLQLALAAEE
ncbi:MAG: type II secretion system protein [Planctomycetota bacterium]|nr:type II secretion system protein [Planctomycetota bacterium]